MSHSYRSHSETGVMRLHRSSRGLFTPSPQKRQRSTHPSAHRNCGSLPTYILAGSSSEGHRACGGSWAGFRPSKTS
jgi:hypothetical protein